MDEASRFHRVSLMHAGKILASGEPEKIRMLAQGAIVSSVCADASQQVAAVHRLTQTFPQLEVLGQDMRIFVDQPDPASAKAEVASCLQGIPQQRTEVLEPELEDVFIALLRKKSWPGKTKKHYCTTRSATTSRQWPGN
jgi:ABC-2 type transport system ATP-binding protein